MDKSKDVEGDHNDDVGALETQAKGQQRELGWMPSDESSSTLELSHASPKSKDSFEGHSDKIASSPEDVEGDKIDNVGEGPAQTPALKKKRTSLDGHSDEIASPDKDVEGDDNGDVGASPALKKIRTLSDMYRDLVGPDLGRKLPVVCARWSWPSDGSALKLPHPSPDSLDGHGDEIVEGRDADDRVENEKTDFTTLLGPALHETKDACERNTAAAAKHACTRELNTDADAVHDDFGEACKERRGPAQGTATNHSELAVPAAERAL